MALVGYYSVSDGQGIDAQADDIKMSGNEPLCITDFSPDVLARIDVLYVWNDSGARYTDEFVSAVPSITAAVKSGMNLVIFDSSAATQNPTAILPGTNLKVYSEPVYDIDLTKAGELALSSGPMEGVNDATLDGQKPSSAASIVTETLPPDAIVLATPAGAEGKLTTGFSYTYGEGTVQYYSVPMGTLNESASGWEAFAVNTLSNAVLCFAEGTLIATATGQRRIESLAQGDLVLTHDGRFKPLRRLVCSDADSQMVLVEGLYLSLQHRLLVAGPLCLLWFDSYEVLVPASVFLSFGATLVDARPMYNLLFDDHEVVCANGIAAESLFLGTQTRKGLGRSLNLNAVGNCAMLKMQSYRPLLTVPEAKALLRAQLGSKASLLVPFEDYHSALAA